MQRRNYLALAYSRDKVEARIQDEASAFFRAWAIERRLKRASKQLLIERIADLVKGLNGSVRLSLHDLGTLMGSASLSTIRRNLADLVQDEVMYCARSSQRGPHGHYGKNEFVLLATEESRAYAKSLGWVPAICDASSNDQNEHATHVQSGHTTYVQNEHASHVHFEPNGDISCASQSVENENEKGVIAHTPARAVNYIDNIQVFFDRSDPEAPAQSQDPIFEDFAALWPWTNEMPGVAMRAFAKMSPADKLLAIQGVPAFLAERQRARKRPGRAAAYLKDTGWLSMSSRAKPAIKLTFVWRGSRPWDAWVAYGHRKTLWLTRSDGTGIQREGWDFPSLWPPGAERDNRAAPRTACTASRTSGEPEMAQREAIDGASIDNPASTFAPN